MASFQWDQTNCDDEDGMADFEQDQIDGDGMTDFYRDWTDSDNKDGMTNLHRD